MKRFGKAVKKGFTLVELVIVIAVIAVLSAVLIPTFGGILSNAKVTAMNKTLNSLNSDLLSRALIDNITYYTPDAVRGILEEKNFKAEDIPEGYTVWYNQKTCNITLKKDSDVFVGSTASAGRFDEAGIKTVKADGGSIDFTGVDRLPRRPEALSADKNELVLFTPNSEITNIINEMYTIATSTYTEGGIDESSFNGVISGIRSKLNNVLSELGNLYNDKDAAFASVYGADFDPDTTLYVTDDGYMYTNAINGSSNVIKNVVFCKDASGNAASSVNMVVTPNTAETNKYKPPVIECPLELPASVKTIKATAVESFNSRLSSVVIIVRSEVDTSEIDANNGATIVTAKRGDSTTGGSSTSPVSYIGYDQMKNSLKLEDGMERYYTRSPYGYIADATAGITGDKQAWLTSKSDDVSIKFVVPTFSIDLKKAMEIVGISGNLSEALRTVEYKDQGRSDYRTFFMIATYEVTENNTAKMKGVRFDTMFGYITNVSDYVSSGIKEYTPATSNESAAFGDFRVVVPSAAKSFVNYEGFEVYVDYFETTRYYEKVKDTFGKDSFKYSGDAWSLKTDKQLISDDRINFTFANDYTGFAPVNHSSFSGKSNYVFKNLIELNRVTIKKNGKVLFVKYYDTKHESDIGSDIYNPNK